MVQRWPDNLHVLVRSIQRWQNLYLEFHVELIEIREFLERYSRFFFSPRLEQVHPYGEATRTNWRAGYALTCYMAEKFGVQGF